jgi:hypothetical protein
MEDPYERRALLLHLGDVFEAIHGVLQTGTHYRTIQQAIDHDDALVAIPLLGCVAPDMTPHQFAQRAASAFLLWPKQLLEPTLNRKALASTVQHDLFADNQFGWDAYTGTLHAEVPWFGIDLPPVPERRGKEADQVEGAEHRGGHRDTGRQTSMMRSPGPTDDEAVATDLDDAGRDPAGVEREAAGAERASADVERERADEDAGFDVERDQSRPGRADWDVEQGGSPSERQWPGDRSG